MGAFPHYHSPQSEPPARNAWQVSMLTTVETDALREPRSVAGKAWMLLSWAAIAATAIVCGAGAAVSF